MITHQGVAYWTTQELANSLAARGVIDPDDSRRDRLRLTRKWAAEVDLRPSARAKGRGRELLWGDEEVQEALDGVDD